MSSILERLRAASGGASSEDQSRDAAPPISQPLPPPLHPSTPTPCPLCLSPIFWLDPYQTIRCYDCFPPPSPALARQMLCVVSLRSTTQHTDATAAAGSLEYAWRDFHDETDAAWSRVTEAASARPTRTQAAGFPPQAASRARGALSGNSSLASRVSQAIFVPELEAARDAGWSIDDWWDSLAKPRQVMSDNQTFAELLAIANMCMRPEELGWPVLSSEEKARAERNGIERRAAIARGEDVAEVVRLPVQRNKKYSSRRK